jgi:hypothetical protein
MFQRKYVEINETRLYAEYTFSVRLIVFDVIKQNWVNMKELLH